MKVIVFLSLILLPVIGRAQYCEPLAVYTYLDKDEYETDSVRWDDNEPISQQAPLEAKFYACPADTVGWTTHYEWTITNRTKNETIIQRYDENLEYTFRNSGTYAVQLRATYLSEDETYSDENNPYSFTVTIPQSVLEFPNTITPRADSNKVLKAKDTHQSIVEFKATVFTRSGQKIHEWTDIRDGWDGRWNGSYVKDGAYYLVVEAKGADGHKYNIRKAINVLTSEPYNGSTTN